MTYDEIRPNLRTGDMILFSGTGLASTIIKLMTRSPWSHVGLVVQLPFFDTLLCWESTTLSKMKDITDGTIKKGVQIGVLSERVRTYRGRVGFRPLLIPLQKGELKRLFEFRREVTNRPYEQDELELALSAYDGPLGHNTEDLSSIFCSELVAAAIHRARRCLCCLNSNEYTPADLAKEPGWGGVIEIDKPGEWQR